MIKKVTSKSKSIGSQKKSISKKEPIKTTHDLFLESMTPRQLKKYKEEYQDLLLSELLIELTTKKDISVRKLAQESGVSPTIIQSMRSGENKDYSLRAFFKVLNGLGYKKFKIENTSQSINIQLPGSSKKG